MFTHIQGKNTISPDNQNTRRGTSRSPPVEEESDIDLTTINGECAIQSSSYRPWNCQESSIEKQSLIEEQHVEIIHFSPSYGDIIVNSWTREAIFWSGCMGFCRWQCQSLFVQDEDKGVVVPCLTILCNSVLSHLSYASNGHHIHMNKNIIDVGDPCLHFFS